MPTERPNWRKPLRTTDDFEAFFRDSYEPSLNWIRNRRRHWDDSTRQDVAHNAWVAIHNKVGRIENAQAYLFAVLRTKVADEDLFRRQHSATTLTDEIPSHDMTPEDRVLLSESLAEIERELVGILQQVYTLPERQRDAYRMRVSEGLSSSVIAATMECSPNAVDIMVSRARQSLRDNFGSRALARFEALAMKDR